MKNEIYIGKNGIGKSKKLEDFKKEKNKNSFLIRYSDKTNAPDSNVISKSNELLKSFEAFLNSLFTYEETICLSELNEKHKESFNKINEKLEDDKKLENIWDQMLEDDNLSFIPKKTNSRNSRIIFSKKGHNQIRIIEKMYYLDLKNWKETKTPIPDRFV